jgi:hypothetical protein
MTSNLTMSELLSVKNINASGNIGIGVTNPVNRFKIASDVLYANMANANLRTSAQLVISQATTSGNLYIANAYTPSGGTGSVIQSTDFYSNTDYGTQLFLNPLGGGVVINNTYNAANAIGILGTGQNQTITSGIKVGGLHIGAFYANNNPVIWSETSLTIQASNGTVNMPRNNLSVANGISIADSALSEGGVSYNLSIPGGTRQRMGNLTLNSIQATGDINAGGNITASGDVTAYSDARVKTNIIEIDSPLEKISQLRGVYYNRTDDTNIRHLGVIAQEVESVLPEVVFTDTSLAKNKSVAYGNIVALLIEGMKAQQSTIEGMQNILSLRT